MLGNISSENAFRIVATREILGKCVLDLSLFQKNADCLFKTMNEPSLVALVEELKKLGIQSLESWGTLNDLPDDRIQEIYVGGIYALAQAHFTSPADFSLEEPGKFLSKASTEVDNPPLRRAAEIAFELASCQFNFKLRDLGDWVRTFETMVQKIYERFVFQYFEPESNSIQNVLAAIAFEAVSELNCPDNLPVLDFERIFKEKFSEMIIQIDLRAGPDCFRVQIEQAIVKISEDNQDLMIDANMASFFLKDLTRLDAFCFYCFELKNMSQSQFQSKLRAFLKVTAQVQPAIQDFVESCRPRSKFYRVTCGIKANFVELEQHNFPDLSSIQGMKIEVRNKDKNATVTELVLPKIECETTIELVARSKAIFRYAIELLKAAEETPPRITLSESIEFQELGSERKSSQFKAIYKPWISDFEKKISNFVLAHAKILDDKRPIAEKFRRAIKLHNLAKTEDDPALKCSIIWSMFSTIFGEDRAIFQFLPVVSFYCFSGSVYNEIKSKLQAQKFQKAEVTKFRSELTKIRERNEIHLNLEGYMLALEIQVAAEKISRFGEAAMGALVNCLHSESPTFDDIYDYLDFMALKVANSSLFTEE